MIIDILTLPEAHPPPPLVTEGQLQAYVAAKHILLASVEDNAFIFQNGDLPTWEIRSSQGVVDVKRLNVPSDTSIDAVIVDDLEAWRIAAFIITEVPYFLEPAEITEVL